MELETLPRWLDDRLKSCTAFQILLVSLIGIVAIGIPDYLIGTDVSLSIFYFFPVGTAAWYAGNKTGTLTAILCTLPELAGELAAGHYLNHPKIVIWNVVLVLVTMLIFVRLIVTLGRQLDRERTLARTDPVTGIFNRRAFMDYLGHSIDLMERSERQIALAYIDLDDFKQINDRRGHDEGDRVLQQVADVLVSCVRKSDVVARLGGDEFALLIVDTNRMKAESCIGKIRESLHHVFESEQPPVTCSIGCVIFGSHPLNVQGAIRAADLLMYKVKSRGKDGVDFEDFVHRC